MISLSPRTKAIFIALGIFAIGIVCGALGQRYLQQTERPPFSSEGTRRGGPSRADRVLDIMTRNLALTEDQRRAIGGILHQSREEIGSIRAQIREQMQAREATVREKIRAVLTEEQREKYDATMQRMERRRMQDHRPPPGP